MNPLLVWNKLLEMFDKDPTRLNECRAKMVLLERRGMLRSKESLAAAMQLATEAGLVWDATRHRFNRRTLRRFRRRW